MVSLQDEMKDLAAQARRVGINLSLTRTPSNAVFGARRHARRNRRRAGGQAENCDGGWVYGPGYLPTGEPLFNPGASGNAESYSDPQVTRLIQATITGPARSEATALTAYDNTSPSSCPSSLPNADRHIQRRCRNSGREEPGGYAANALGLMNPEDWYFTR